MKKLNEEQKEFVKEVIADTLGCDIEELKEEANLYNDLGCDSLDFLELVINVEKALDIHIPDSEIESVQTIGEVFNVVAKLF